MDAFHQLSTEDLAAAISQVGVEPNLANHIASAFVLQEVDNLSAGMSIRIGGGGMWSWLAPLARTHARSTRDRMHVPGSACTAHTHDARIFFRMGLHMVCTHVSTHVDAHFHIKLCTPVSAHTPVHSAAHADFQDFAELSLTAGDKAKIRSLESLALHKRSTAEEGAAWQQLPRRSKPVLEHSALSYSFSRSAAARAWSATRQNEFFDLMQTVQATAPKPKLLLLVGRHFKDIVNRNAFRAITIKARTI